MEAGIYSGYSTLKQEENSALKSFMFPLQIMSDWLISQLKGLKTWQYFWGENFEHLTTIMVKIGQIRQTYVMYLAKILFYNFGFNRTTGPQETEKISKTIIALFSTF